MPKNINKTKRGVLYFAAFFAAIFTSAIINSGSAFAANANGIITGDDGVRWEYNVNDQNSDKAILRIAFYDKPATLKTVTVPSLDKLKSLISGVNSVTTYFLEDANIETQDANYTSYERRTATESTTKLDMANTSKIQIRGVKPIIDPAVETELVFGSNMVIGDRSEKALTAYQLCTNWVYTANNWGGYWNCPTMQRGDIVIYSESLRNAYPNYDYMTFDEKEAIKATLDDFNAIEKTYFNSGESAIPGKNYVGGATIKTVFVGGAFSGYKLKLTNFKSSNFNYVGYQAFKDSTFNDANTTITVDGNSLMGGQIFAGTNVKNITINTDKYGHDMFDGCTGIEKISFGSNASIIQPGTFTNTNLTSLDLSNTTIKTIRERAFQKAKLTSVNFGNIERIEWQAFQYNSLSEISLPKSIRYLQSDIFFGNNIKKVTIAYDTLTSGTTLPFYVVMDGYVRGTSNKEAQVNTVEEITILAPYAENEAVIPTHVSYFDYIMHYDRGAKGDDAFKYVEDTGYNKYVGYGWADWNSWHTKYNRNASIESEKAYAKLDEKKNIIAPDYFSWFASIKKITIGDGMEYIGSAAFYDNNHNDFGSIWPDRALNCESDKPCSNTNSRWMDEINIPESVKGIGTVAFDGGLWNSNMKISIPKNIEFIGIAAFRRAYTMNLDINFPELEFLGDYAFESTFVHDVYLHDKIKYYGTHVFSNCPNLNDITFDFDVFSPDIPTPFSSIEVAGGTYGDMKHFKKEFGEWYGWYYGRSEDAMKRWGMKYDKFPIHYSGNFQKFGNITFTEKAVHQMPFTKINTYVETSDVFFGQVIADKVDLSKTNWTVIGPNTFSNSMIGEVLLPDTVEVIGNQAFNHFITQEELVLPDSVRMIGDRAFECHNLSHYGQTIPTAKITKLPSSLEYVGVEAFAYDYNLTGDLEAPNLKYIGIGAFRGTNVRDVLIPNGVKSLREGTFAEAPSLRNITFDSDFGSIVKTSNVIDSIDYMPQSLLDWTGGDTNYAYRALKNSKIETQTSYDSVLKKMVPFSFDGGNFLTFYTIFNHKLVDTVTENNVTKFGQTEADEHYGIIKFTENAKTDVGGSAGVFSAMTFEEFDMSESGWKRPGSIAFAFDSAKIGTLKLPNGLETVTTGAFENAVVDNSVTLPDSLKTLEAFAFQWSKIPIENAIPEGVETIQYAAFYGADITDNLVIPGSVTAIQPSAFNAGDRDIHYDTITIKPAEFGPNQTSGQMIHQMFWNADVDKMTIESSSLPAYLMGEGVGHEEFYNMAITEITLTNAPKITANAFAKCSKLEKVDAGKNTALRSIGTEAFKGAEKLHIFNFAPGLKDETVTIGSNAFEGTAFNSIGKADAEFNLYAAHFDGSDTHAFANMPKVKTVDVPGTFSNGTIPEATFANETELEEATVDYRIKKIDNAAFANDNKLARIFIWGNAVVFDENLPGYTAPVDGGMGAEGDENPETFGPTIPEGTDIYAYSTSPTEKYAASDSRSDFDGVFYPLDEVIYLAANKTHVKVEEDDFDKSGLILYGLRRDGIVLESDNWNEFSGNAFARSDKDIHFEKMLQTIATDPDFGTIWDTPVPLAELSLANENFENVKYTMLKDEATEGVSGVDVEYNDKYTNYLSSVNLLPLSEDEPIIPFIPLSPKTLDSIMKFVMIFMASAAVMMFVSFVKHKTRHRR